MKIKKKEILVQMQTAIFTNKAFSEFHWSVQYRGLMEHLPTFISSLSISILDERLFLL